MSSVNQTSKVAGRDARLTNKAYESLLKDILSGRRRAGEPLSELALTRKLGVSRTPIHNAILQLIKDGLVRQEPNCRPVIRGFTARDIHEMFDMRILLEGEAARLAANRIRKSSLDKIKRQHEKLRNPDNHRDWSRAWADYDEEFHRTISNASGNKRLADDVSRYRLLHRGLNIVGFDEEHAPLNTLRSAIDEHERILGAIGKGDAEAARDAMRMHLRTWQVFFSELFDKAPDDMSDSPNLIVFNQDG